jgi:hypothetical protein
MPVEHLPRAKVLWVRPKGPEAQSTELDSRSFWSRVSGELELIAGSLRQVELELYKPTTQDLDLLRFQSKNGSIQGRRFNADQDNLLKKVCTAYRAHPLYSDFF